MSEIRFFKPAPGRLVRDPITGQPLPAGGAPVNLSDQRRNQFYLRRLKDGDLTELSSQAPAPAAKPQANPKGEDEK